MKKVLLFFSVFITISNLFTYSQYFEYRLDESSAISWNGINIFDARQLGAGDVSFFASRTFTGLSNPALISIKKSPSLGISFSTVTFDSFQYRGINEGVETSSNPLTGTYGNINAISTSFKLSIFKINLGWFISDILRFPSFEFRNEYGNNQYDFYKGVFTGKKNNFFSAVSFDINKNLTLGLKLDYIFGKRDIIITQHSSYYYTVNGNSLLIDKYTENIETNNIDQLISTIGFNYILKPGLYLSLAFIIQVNGNVKREIKRSFINPTWNINITNTENVSDPYYSPARIHFGIKKDFNLKTTNPDKEKKIILAFESKLILWSDYKYILFGEDVQRDMKNSFVTGVGFEYGIYSKKTDLFFRTGLKIDPQPVKTVNTILKVLSGGFGIRIGRLSADIGAAYWFSSIGGIKRDDLIVSTTINFSFGR